MSHQVRNAHRAKNGKDDQPRHQDEEEASEDDGPDPCWCQVIKESTKGIRCCLHFGDPSGAVDQLQVRKSSVEISRSELLYEVAVGPKGRVAEDVSEFVAEEVDAGHLDAIAHFADGFDEDWFDVAAVVVAVDGTESAE